MSATDLPAETTDGIRELVRDLRSDDVDRSYRAGNALGQLGKAAVADLIAATVDTRPHVRECALYGLRTLSHRAPETAPVVFAAVRPLLHDPEPIVKRLACGVISCFGMEGRKANEAVPDLLLLLSDPDQLTVTAAATACSYIGPGAAAAAPLLAAAAEKYLDDDSYTREAAVQALGAVGVRDPAHLPLLLRALQKDDVSLQEKAAESLGGYGQLGKPAVPLLRKCLRKDEPSLKIAVLCALGKIEPGEEPVRELLKLAREGDEDTRGLAIVAIEELGSAAASALPELHRIMRDDPEQSVRDIAAHVVRVISAQVK